MIIRPANPNNTIRMIDVTIQPEPRCGLGADGGGAMSGGGVGGKGVASIMRANYRKAGRAASGASPIMMHERLDLTVVNCANLFQRGFGKRR